MRMFKRFFPLILACALILPQAMSVCASDSGRAVIFVATNGDDNNPGTIDLPLQTPEGARDKIRELKKTGTYNKGYTVYFRGGEYLRSKSFELTEEDSGTEGAPVVYRNYGDEVVTFVGGAILTGKDFMPLTDQALTDRIVDTSARNKIYYVDLKEHGITDVGSVFLKGAYSYPQYDGAIPKPTAPASEVLFNGAEMTVARYPNNGEIKIEKVIEPGWDHDKPDDMPKGTPFVIEVGDSRIEKWSKAPKNSIVMFGFWKFDWADQSIPISEIDVSTKRIKSHHCSTFSVLPGRSFYVFNLLEELDLHGEYYMDYENCVLYIYPPSDISRAQITVSLMEDIMLKLTNTEYISFKNIDFTASRNHVISISGGHHNVIDSSDISYSAMFSVLIDGGHDNIIKHSYIHDVNGGIQLGGGDFNTLTPAKNKAVNNHIENFSRITKTYILPEFQGF